MDNDFGTLTDLGIAFSEAVIHNLYQANLDPNVLSEADWNNLYDGLSTENLSDRVLSALNIALNASS